MDLSLTDAEQGIRMDVEALLERECPLERVRQAEPLGFDRGLWRQLASEESVALAMVSERSLSRLAIAMEAVGRHLAPAPLAEVASVTRLLARADAAESQRWIRAAGERGAAVTLALAPPQDGVARLVPSGAIADVVVVRDGDDLLTFECPATGESPSNLGASPIADLELTSTSGRRIASGPSARELHDRAVDDWRVLTASALVGLAAGALRLAVEYVCRRQQFGSPIGAFQSVQHRLADLATAVDGARLLAQEAAWAKDEAEPDAPALAAMALVYGAETAQQCAKDSLHYHGGYGFTLEYDVQLYFRRAAAWPLALEDPKRGLLCVADRLFGAPGT